VGELKLKQGVIMGGHKKEGKGYFGGREKKKGKGASRVGYVLKRPRRRKYCLREEEGKEKEGTPTILKDSF